MLLPVFLPLVFSVAFHHETRSIEDKDGRHIEGDHHLQLFLAVLDQFSGTTTICKIHGASIGALVEPAISINGYRLSRKRSYIFRLGDRFE